METMRALPVVALSLIVAGAAAQNSDLFDRAPPHVDKALRARIDVFYGSHVDGKWRTADTVVHEESKDAFFVAPKDRYHGYDIVRIEYSDNFSAARAVVAVETDLVWPGFGRKRVKVPLTTLWKLDNGEWWWHVRPASEGVETPFGMMNPGPDPEKAEVYDKIANMPTMSAILSQVKVSKTEVLLSSYEPASDEIVVTNDMPGKVSLTFQAPTFTGFEYELDKTELGAGEKAVIVFRCKPENRAAKPTLQGKLAVAPTNHVIPIRITFAIPPEVEEQIRKSVRTEPKRRH